MQVSLGFMDYNDLPLGSALRVGWLAVYHKSHPTLSVT